MSGFFERLRQARLFAASDIWDVDILSLSRARGLLVKTLRVVQLVWRGFSEDECPMHASALTFTTLMSIVPVLAMSLALARGLGGEEFAKDRIRKAVGDWTSGFVARPADAAAQVGQGAASDPAAEGAFNLAESINGVVEDAFQKIEKINFGAVGGVGLALLLWMTVSVLGQVESSFNRVWGVTSGRPLWRKFTDYLSMLLVLPILIVAATSLPLADVIGRHLPESGAAAMREALGSPLLKGTTVVAATCAAFSLLIMFMPHARVRPWPGIAGGAVTAVLFLGWLRLCAALQVGVAGYGRIYGSFAVVPILLAWVYVSWEIVLLGAELAFAVQNCTTYRMEQGAGRASADSRAMLALSVAGEAARALLGLAPAFDAGAFARTRQVPVRLLNDVIGDLVRAGLLAELSEPRGCYALLRAPDALRVDEVIGVVLRAGSQPRTVGLERLEGWVHDAIARAAGGVQKAFEGATLGDLVRTSNTEQRTANTERRTSNIEH